MTSEPTKPVKSSHRFRNHRGCNWIWTQKIATNGCWRLRATRGKVTGFKRSPGVVVVVVVVAIVVVVVIVLALVVVVS